MFIMSVLHLLLYCGSRLSAAAPHAHHFGKAAIQLEVKKEGPSKGSAASTERSSCSWTRISTCSSIGHRYLLERRSLSTHVRLLFMSSEM